MITLKNVSKYYYNKGIIASGFTKLNLSFHLGEFVAITGESGSGKSTLLNVISGLDSYEEGEMYIDGKETSHYTETDFENYRREYISNIFQNFNLVNSYTVYQNIELVMLTNGKKGREVKQKVLALIDQVGLHRYKNTKVSKLSGGQKQRVAIARALAKETPILIADEPTGNLDSTSALEIIQLLHDISKDKLVIIVTHNYEQVEKYVTRKIKMHDGKVLEDKVLKKTKEVNYTKNEKQRNLCFSSKLKLGFRNAFNIFPKFVLVLMVYLFVVSSVMLAYSFFKKQIYLLENNGYNSYFQDTSSTRLVIKKEDKSVFSDEDYEKIKSISHVKKVVPYDLNLDNVIYLHDDNSFYFQGVFDDVQNFSSNKKLKYGTLPVKDDEILILGSPNDYVLSDLGKDIIGKKVTLSTQYTSEDSKTYTITGVFYDKNLNYYDIGKIYGTNHLVDELKFSMNQSMSQLKVLFLDEYHDSNSYDVHYRIIPSDKVQGDDVYISSDFNSSCKNDSCLGYPLKIEVNQLYYQDSLSLKVGKTYQKNNMKTLLGDYSFEEYNGAIFISTDNYNRLFNKGNYQSSIFVDSEKNIDIVREELTKNNISSLKIKDTLVNDGAVEEMKIIQTIVIVTLFITLFFIAYFVIRIILKSRNIYFGTIRILGAKRSDCKQLLEIELFTVFHLAYFLFLFLLYGNWKRLFHLSIFTTVSKYLVLSDYLLLYLILVLMSYLISVRFARKIFCHSAMKTMREEV